MNLLWLIPLHLALAIAELQQEKAVLVKKLLKKYKKHEGNLRLVGGRNPNQGGVEIWHGERWGGICDDEWDMKEAQVVCGQLGFPGALRITHSSAFGPPTDKYWMDNLYCTGGEKRLTDCRFDGWGVNDCGPDEGAGVECLSLPETSTLPPTQPPRIKVKDREELELRLRGGRLPSEGYVEAKSKSSPDWRGVCGDGWSLLEGSVTCRQLGLGFVYAAPHGPVFPGDMSIIGLSGVECHGNESSLSQCQRHAREDLFCPEELVAGVICTHQLADLQIEAEEIERSAHLEDRLMYQLSCALEENCLSSPAYSLPQDTSDWWYRYSRRLLRFTAAATNIGNADFRPDVPKHLWQWHQCHMHYHSMEVFATFDVISSSGERVAEGHKASFCLEDNACLGGVPGRFQCANYGDQGISPNCTDVYKSSLDCQWVDISELPPGNYTLKIAVNPEFKIAEQSFENNAAVCSLEYTPYSAKVFGCVVTRP